MRMRMRLAILDTSHFRFGYFADGNAAACTHEAVHATALLALETDNDAGRDRVGR